MLPHFNNRIPLTELDEKIQWFYNIFEKEIIKEGWYFKVMKQFTIWENNKRTYQVMPTENLNGKVITNDEALNYATQYGWIIDEYLYVKDFDINKLERNKHLITGNELGLL